jgi:hypothetical protein
MIPTVDPVTVTRADGSTEVVGTATADDQTDYVVALYEMDETLAATLILLDDIVADAGTAIGTNEAWLAETPPTPVDPDPFNFLNDQVRELTAQLIAMSHLTIVLVPTLYETLERLALERPVV